MLNNFHEVRLPDDISYGAKSIVEFFNQVVKKRSGHEVRNKIWQKPLLKYDISYGISNERQVADLISFFRNRQGRLYGFRFKDWSDYKLENQVIAIADGQTAIFPIIKSYNYAGFSVDRRVYKPVDNSVDVLLGLSYVVDYSEGLVVFEQPPASGVEIVINGEFDVPVRFADDSLEVTMNNEDLGSLDKIELIEVL